MLQINKKHFQRFVLDNEGWAQNFEAPNIE